MAAAWAVRVVRGLWPDRNPLRRTIDRAEAVVVAGLAIVFLAGPPLQPSLVSGQAMLAAIFAALVVAIIVVCAGLLAHVALDRRRLAGWGAQWRATGPQWTRQR